MNKKILALSLIAIIVLALAFILYRYGLSWVSADTNNATETGGSAGQVEAVSSDAPMLVLDDDSAVVTEGQAITMRIKINFPAVEKYAKEQLKKRNIGSSFYLVGKLGNAVKISDGTELVKNDNFSKAINSNYSNGSGYSKFGSEEYTLNINVPAGAFKDNKITNKLTLYSCRFSDGNSCWKAASFYRTKIAEITHDTAIDYTENVVDLSAQGGIAAQALDYLIPGKDNQDTTTFDFNYLNNSANVADNVTVKFYAPKGTFEIERVKSKTSRESNIKFTTETQTLTDGTTEKEYDVTSIKIGTVSALGSDKLAITVKALRPDNMTGNEIVYSYADIYTDSKDNNIGNNRVTYQTYFGIFTVSRSQ